MRITENDYLYITDINGKSKGPSDNIIVLKNKRDNETGSHRFHMLKESGPLKKTTKGIIDKIEKKEEEPDLGEFFDTSA